MISIITVGRADNHTGDFVGRLIYTAQFNARALTAAGIPHQFVFVEWNSPHATLGSVANRYVREVPNARAYVVGPEWHAHVCDNPNMVIMEFFAKNVALRRCETPVAVCTNADILFGPDTVDVLRGWAACNARTLYRTIHRHDVMSSIKYSTPDQLTDSAIIKKSWTAKRPAFTQGAGDFQMASIECWKWLRGYDETIRWAKIHKDHRLCTQTLKRGGKIVAVGSCYHLYHKSSYVNQTEFLRNAPWGPEYNPGKWMPYRNDMGWGLSYSRLYRVGNVELLLPPAELRVIPELMLKPVPIGVKASSAARKSVARKSSIAVPRAKVNSVTAIQRQAANEKAKQLREAQRLAKRLRAQMEGRKR